MSLAGVSGVQKRYRFKRRGDPRQDFSIVDTHEPANIRWFMCVDAWQSIAMLLSPPCLHMMIRILGRQSRHQGVRRFVSPCLHHIKSVSSRMGKTYDDLVRFVFPESDDVYLTSSSLQNGDPLGSISQGDAGVRWGDLTRASR